MPRSFYVAATLLWASIFSACLCPPSAEALLDVGFRSPEQTLHTFQTALRADLPGLEYRCLGAAFKRREGVNELAYREFRAQLFHDKPWLKLAAEAEIDELIELGPGRRRIVATVSNAFADETFAVDFVREEFYETWSGEELVDDDIVSFEEITASDGASLTVVVPLFGDVPVDDVTEVRAGKEWKIDGFPLQDAL